MEWVREDKAPTRIARPAEKVGGTGGSPEPGRMAGRLLQLQRGAGNRAVTQLIQRRPMQVGPGTDPAEREADRVAGQVMSRLRGFDIETPGKGPGVGVTPIGVQRRPGRSPGGPAGRVDHGPQGGTLAPEVATDVEQARSGGSPLAAGVSGSLGSALGADLSSVRVHTDGRADRLNRSLHAEAFTTGSDVFFRHGAYQPGSGAGTELLAHELTHVVQQGGASTGMVQRSLVRDRVFSDAEFTQGMPAARQGGGEEGNWATLVAALKDLEKKHTTLGVHKGRMAKDDPNEQRFAGRQRNLERTAETGTAIVGSISDVVATAEAYIAHEEVKTSGVGGTVKGLFKGKAAKAGKASRVDQVRTLLFQLRRRRDQLFAENEKHRFDLMSLKKQEIDAEKEGPKQKQAAMDQARHGTFGMHKGTVNNANFGQGAMNSVAQVDYQDEKGELFKGVFKSEPDKLGANDGGMTALGTNENSPNLSMRSVAASKLNELLGMKVIPKTELAFHEQMGFGQVMALAGGKSPKTKTSIEIEDADPAKIARIEQVLKEEEKQFGAQSTLVTKQSATGEVKHFLEENITFQTDWDNPILKRELASLQLMDGLIGNVDRHCENYFIQVDAFGNPIGVLGIDNDLTFAREHNDPTEIAFSQGHHAGLPPAVDSYVAEKFCAVTESQVRSAVKGLLTGLEVETLIVRLKAIQVKLDAKGPGGYLIPRIGNDQEGARQWTELKDPSKIKGAYFARERNWQQGDMKDMGRLVKPEHALLYKEDRMTDILKKVEALQG
jgi:hypothetical protein